MNAQLDFPRTKKIDLSFSYREKNPKMKILTALLAAVVALTLPFNAFAEFIQQPAAPAADPTQNSAPPTGTQTRNRLRL